MTMDIELVALARQALLDAFYEDFSALVNTYIKAAKGLDQYNTFEQSLLEVSDVYGRMGNPQADIHLNIWVKYTSRFGHSSTAGFGNLAEALLCKEAIEITVQNRKVFERRLGEWYYVGE